MSLVAYGASDDSDTSDAEDAEVSSDVASYQNGPSDIPADTPQTEPIVTATVSRNNNNNNNTRVSNSSHDVIDDSNGSTEKELVKTANEGDGISGTISDDEEPTVLLRDLPAPKLEHALKPSLDVTEDDELEEMVKPKPSQLADISRPGKKAKGRQPVKISIPALFTDSDEEDEPKRKKLKPSSSSGGFLTALLPAPRHAITKETNRLLLPHVLGKKTQQFPANTAKSSQSKSPVTGLKQTKVVRLAGVPDSDSDDEDSPGISFFSLENDSKIDSASSFYKTPTVSSTMTSPGILTTAATHTSSTVKIAVSDKDNTGDDVPLVSSTTVSHDVNESVSASEAVASDSMSDPDADPDGILATQDLPLSFKSQPTSSYNPGTALNFKYGSSRPSSYIHSVHHSQPGYAGYHGEMPDATVSQQQGLSDQGEGSEQVEWGESAQSDVAHYLQDEEFLKLQGKKQRGREAVNIIDINTDEFTSTKDVMKTLTVEQEHTAHRKKDNQPTSRSRHKHQITYLAFQAKERELNLKNQWAQNRQTKRQTQSKYGF